MATQEKDSSENDILYKNKEKNLGLTTFTFRSKRYSFPSVIVKSDIQTEGVCVMLDVGLFCPFCSGNFKSRYVHKRSRLAISQKASKHRHHNIDSESTSQGGVSERSQDDVEGSGSESPYFEEDSCKRESSQTFMSEFEGSDQGAYDGVISKGKPLIDKGGLTKPDLSILDEFEIEPDPHELENVNKSNFPTQTIDHSVDSSGVVSEHSRKLRDFKSNVSITKTHAVKELDGGAEQTRGHNQRGMKLGSGPSMGIRSESNNDSVDTEYRQVSEALNLASNEEDSSYQHASHQNTNVYIPRAEREKLQTKSSPLRKYPEVDMTSHRPTNNKQQETQQVEPLRILAASVLNTEREEKKEDLIISDHHKIHKASNSTEDSGAFNTTTQGHWVQEPSTNSIGRSQCSVDSLETRGHSPLHQQNNEEEFTPGLRTDTTTQVNELVLGHEYVLTAQKQEDHAKQMASNNASYAKLGDPGTSAEACLSANNIDSRALGPENPTGSAVVDRLNQNVLRASNTELSWQSNNRNTTTSGHSTSTGFSGISVLDQAGISLSRDDPSRQDNTTTTEGFSTSVKQETNATPSQEIDPNYFKDLLCGANSFDNKPPTYHSVDRLYTYDETSSEASSVIHLPDDTVLSQQAYGSSRDTLLTDELLTDDITSEDENYKDVDEETLKTIEQKLLENLAKLDVCERNLDQERAKKIQQRQTNAPPPEKNIGDLKSESGSIGDIKENIVSKEDSVLSTKTHDKVLIHEQVSGVSQTVYQNDNKQTDWDIRTVQDGNNKHIARQVLKPVYTDSSTQGGSIPSGKEMYERAFDMLVEGEGEIGAIEIPFQDNEGSRPKATVHKGCCRSYSPEVMMEQILDELENESETYSADATLGRVFSVRREKRMKPVLDDHVEISGDTSRDSEDIGEMYDFMKTLNSNGDQPEKHEDEDQKQDVVDFQSTKKSVSLNDLLDEEILCAKDLNETFSTVERGGSMQEPEGEASKDLNETMTTLDDSVFSLSPKNKRPISIDEIFESAFEHALEDDENVKSWTSDYESDVRGSNDTSQTASLDKHTRSVTANEHYLNGFDFNKKPKTSSVECTVSDRSESIASETNSNNDNVMSPRNSKVSSSTCSTSSLGDSDSDSAFRLPVRDMVAEINKLTAKNNQHEVKKNIGHPKKVRRSEQIHDELNVETMYEHRTVTQEELFHTPDSVCAPRSPTIVQKPQISLAKMQKIPLISDNNASQHYRSPGRQQSPVKSPGYYSKDEIWRNNTANNLSSPPPFSPTSGSSIPPFGRQLSIDEMSEGSTMSSIDEFIPETEEYNAPPEVLEEAYHAAIEVAQMFQQHHVQHPCFQKIIEEISSSRESLYKSGDDGSRSNTLKKWKPSVSKISTNETAEKEEQELVQQPQATEEIIETEEMDVVASEPSGDDKQQMLQKLFGTSHTDHKQKHKDMQEVCRSCAIKSNEDITVKSEEVSTQEVTLIFAWPKGKGKMLPKGLAPNPYRELHMHRVMKVDDLDVEIIEGPTIKSITNVPQNQKSITAKESSAGDRLETSSDKSQNDIVGSLAKIEKQQNVSTYKHRLDSEATGPIIADVDVKVKTTKFEPKSETLIIERQSSSEKKTVENITDNIVKVLSQNNTVEVNDTAQLSIQYKDGDKKSDSLQDMMLQCTAEDITLYAETFFDLVFYDAVEVACALLQLAEEDESIDASSSASSGEHYLKSTSQSSQSLNSSFEIDQSTNSLPQGSKHSAGSELNNSDVMVATSSSYGLSSNEDELSLLALDILESTENLASAQKTSEATIKVEQNIQQTESLPEQTRPMVQSEQQLELINKDLDLLFPEGRMYSSLQDIEVLTKPKARHKRLSLSDTLLENAEKEVRRATSFDEITSIIDDCALTLENSLRTSGELLLKSPETTDPEKLEQNNGGTTEMKNVHAGTSLGTIHEGTTKVSKKQAPPIKPKPKVDGIHLSGGKHKGGKVSLASAPPNKIRPPVKPKPLAYLMNRVRSVSEGDINSSEPTQFVYKAPSVATSSGTVDKVPPPVKPKVNNNGFLRAASDTSVKESAFDQAYSTSTVGTKKTPPPVKPKPSKHLAADSGKRNASDTNANFMLSLEELKPIDDQINHSWNVHSTACYTDDPAKLDCYNACAVSNTECTPSEAASTECLECGPDVTVNANTAQLNSSRSLHSTNNNQISEVQDSIEAEIEKFIEELTVMCHSPDNSQGQNKYMDQQTDLVLPGKLGQKKTPISPPKIYDTNETILLPEPVSGTNGSTITPSLPNRSEKVKHTTQYNGNVSDVHPELGKKEMCVNVLETGMANHVHVFHDYIDTLVASSMEMAWSNIKGLLSEGNSYVPQLTVEQVTKEVEWYVSNLVTDTLEDVIEAFSEASDITSTLSTDHLASEQHDVQESFPPFKAMSQSYNENLESLNVKGNLNTLSSSEPVIVWDNDTSTFKWEKTQSDPVFGKSQTHRNEEPLYFGSETFGSSSMTIHDSNRTLTTCQSQDTLILPRHLTRYADGLSSSGGYPESSKSYSPNSTHSPTCLTSVSQQLCSTPSSSTSDDLDTSGSLSTLDELVELNRAILENTEIIKKHEDILRENTSLGQHVEANNNTMTNRSEQHKYENFENNEVEESDMKHIHYRTSLEMYINKALPSLSTSERQVAVDNINKTTNDGVYDSDSRQKRYPNYNRRQNEIYQKSLHVEHLRRDSDVSSESDVDYSDYKTFITDDLIRTDIDGAEVAQYSSSPFYYSGRDNVSTGSEGMLRTSAENSSPRTEATGECSVAGTISSDGSVYDDQKNYSFLESQNGSLAAGESFATVSKQFCELNKALVEIEGNTSPSVRDEDNDEVKSIVEFKSKSPQTLSAAKRPRVLVRANTWDNVYSNKVDNSSHRMGFTLHSSAMSPSFSPTSSSAFNIRDDDYAKQSRQSLRQKASNSPGFLSEPKDIDGKRSNEERKFFDIQSHLSETKKQVLDSPEQLPRSNSHETRNYGTVSERHSWVVEKTNNGNSPMLPRSLSYEVPKTLKDHSPQSCDVDHRHTYGEQSAVMESRTANTTTRRRPQGSDCSFIFRRHSTGDIVSSSDNELMAGGGGHNVAGKPPTVPRRSSKYTKPK